MDWSFLRTAPQETATAPPTQKLPRPTLALPGTVEKLEVIQMRIRFRQCLRHPDDATWREFWFFRQTRPRRAKNGRDGPPTIVIDGVGYWWNCRITMLDGQAPPRPQRARDD